jgi:hypothetical protein
VKPAGVLTFYFWDGVAVRQEICGGINGLLEFNESLVVRLGPLAVGYIASPYSSCKSLLPFLCHLTVSHASDVFFTTFTAIFDFHRNQPLQSSTTGLTCLVFKFSIHR